MDTATISHFRPSHNSPPQIVFLTLDAVTARLAFQKSYLYESMQSGVFPPPIKVGRSSRWLEAEVVAVQRAMTRGVSREELRETVRVLVADR